MAIAWGSPAQAAAILWGNTYGLTSTEVVIRAISGQSLGGDSDMTRTTANGFILKGYFFDEALRNSIYQVSRATFDEFQDVESPCCTYQPAQDEDGASVFCAPSQAAFISTQFYPVVSSRLVH
jgi:hypothetical protein